AGVKLGARLGRADRDALALEVFQGPDARLSAGDDVDVVGVGGGDGAQLLQRRPEAGLGDAVPGIVDRVAEGERQLAATGLQQIEVFDRCLGGLHRDPNVFDVGVVDLRQADPDRIVDAAGAAGQDVDEGR